jgi:hypothetical protein
MLDALHSQAPSTTPASRPSLVIGHPGHELRVFGWLMTARPTVHVLTDGSGSDGEPRIASTTALLEHAGAQPGTIYGRMSDREIYRAILERDHARFIALAEELATEIVNNDVQFVAGDAVEGFNPSHDICRYVINAAVRLASAASRRTINSYAFPLENAPDTGRDGVRGAALRVELDQSMLERKLQAARGYAELAPEVERALQRFGVEPFRTEYLWPVNPSDPYDWDPHRIPFYETYGAERVASGAYEHVVTFRQHVKPLADALFCHCATTA